MEKTCPKCCQTKPLTAFTPNKSKKDGHGAHCRDCYSTYHREYYRHRTANDPEYKDRTKKWRKQYQTDRIESFRKVIREHLSTHPCVTCGETDIVVLDFDHIDPKTKKFAICETSTCWLPIDDILAEIAKCQVLCANCHRRKTAKDAGTWRIRA